jgi:hypothetical protein
MFLIVVMGIFPPLQRQTAIVVSYAAAPVFTEAAGYGFLFSTSEDSIQEIKASSGRLLLRGSTRIDMTRLVIQGVIVASAIGVAFLCLKNWR